MSTENADRADFEKTKAGWYSLWKIEIEAARKFIQPWHDSAENTLEAYLDERSDSKEGFEPGATHANLFWANVRTKEALHFGQQPTIDVSRRHGDADDDPARAGGIVLERVLNSDIERDEDNTERVLAHTLSDFLKIGYLFARIRYTAEFEQVHRDAVLDEETGEELAPAYDGEEKRPTGAGGFEEDVTIEYTYWKDQLWSPCRVFEEMRWWAFRTPMSREEMEENFGKDIAAKVPYKIRAVAITDDEKKEGEADPWERCEVWEIWSKEHRKLFYFVEGYPEILRIDDDPLELRGFWPFPEPVMANATTSKLLPKPDYAFAQDLYDEVNVLTTRINLLESALRVAGVYDSSAKGVQDLISKAGENQLLPVDGWGAFAERGGLKGSIDWLPLEQIANVLDKLRQQLELSKGLLYEVTSVGDLMRGQNDNQYEKAAAAVQRGRYGSVRIDQEQSQLAKWFSALQRLRAEAMLKLFEPETLLERANYSFMDPQEQQAAIAGIEAFKKQFPSYRVKVQADALAQRDFTQLQMERTQFITGIGSLMRDAAPAMERLGPQALPFIVEAMKWTAAGFKGGKTLEPALDRALKAAQQAAQNPQPAGNPMNDPQVVKEQVKVEGQKQIQAAKLETEKQLAVIDIETDAAKQQNQMRYNTQEQMALQQIKNRGEAERIAMRPKPVAGPKKPASGGVL